MTSLPSFARLFSCEKDHRGPVAGAARSLKRHRRLCARLTFASMDTPGRTSAIAKEAFFNVTLPQTDWNPERVETSWRAFNRGTILSTAIHEAYPGHYIPFLWMQHVIRRSANCSAPAPTRGLGPLLRADDARSRRFHRIHGCCLGQLQDALLRDAR